MTIGEHHMNTTLKYLAILILLIACLSSHAQLGTTNQPAEITANTVFEWDAVLTTTSGESVSITNYSIAVFAVSAPVPVFPEIFIGTNTSTSLGGLVTLFPSKTKHELRVKAYANGLQSPWSDAFYVIRSPGNPLSPKNVRIRP